MSYEGKYLITVHFVQEHAVIRNCVTATIDMWNNNESSTLSSAGGSLNHVCLQGLLRPSPSLCWASGAFKQAGFLFSFGAFGFYFPSPTHKDIDVERKHFNNSEHCRLELGDSGFWLVLGFFLFVFLTLSPWLRGVRLGGLFFSPRLKIRLCRLGQLATLNSP